MKLKLPLFVVTLLFAITSATYAQKSPWIKSSSNGNLNKISLNKLDQDESEVFVLSETEFKNQLIGTPLRGNSNRISSNYVLIPN